MEGNTTGEVECPICSDIMDETDQCFKPCKCGFQICLFCLKQIQETGNGKCPQCREPYDPANYSYDQSAESLQGYLKKKQKQKKQTANDSRKHLANCRVIQRNLVYVTNVGLDIAKEEILKKHEYFGQYGKVLKVVVNKSHIYQGTSVSCYVTYSKPEEAYLCIGTVDGCELNGKILKASFGTTKYCSFFIKNKPCPNPDCMYLHHLGDENDRFTKEDMQSGKHLDKIPLPQSNPNYVAPKIGLPPPGVSVESTTESSESPEVPVEVKEEPSKLAKSQVIKPQSSISKPNSVLAKSTSSITTEPKRVWNIPEVQPISIHEELRKSHQRTPTPEEQPVPKSSLPPTASWASKDSNTIPSKPKESTTNTPTVKEIPPETEIVEEKVEESKEKVEEFKEKVEEKIFKPLDISSSSITSDTLFRDDKDIVAEEKPSKQDTVSDDKFFNPILPEKEDSDLETLLSEFKIKDSFKKDEQDKEILWDLSSPPGMTPTHEVLPFPGRSLFSTPPQSPLSTNTHPNNNYVNNISNGSFKEDQQLNELRALIPGVQVRISSNNPSPNNKAPNPSYYNFNSSTQDQSLFGQYPPMFNENANQRLQIFRQLQNQTQPLEMPQTQENYTNSSFNFPKQQQTNTQQHLQMQPMLQQNYQPQNIQNQQTFQSQNQYPMNHMHSSMQQFHQQQYQLQMQKNQQQMMQQQQLHYMHQKQMMQQPNMKSQPQMMQQSSMGSQPQMMQQSTMSSQPQMMQQNNSFPQQMINGPLHSNQQSQQNPQTQQQMQQHLQHNQQMLHNQPQMMQQQYMQYQQMQKQQQHQQQQHQQQQHHQQQHQQQYYQYQMFQKPQTDQFNGQTHPSNNWPGSNDNNKFTPWGQSNVANVSNNNNMTNKQELSSYVYL